jgi:peptidyl-tRNA hydrolase
VQSAHALADFILTHPKAAQKWHKESNYLVTLSVSDETALLQLAQKLSDNGVNYVTFREPDVNNQVTALCIEPSNVVRKLCSNFPLALKEYNKDNNFKIQKHEAIVD